MYNRYIPQPDGSYRRNRMPDPGTPPRPQRPEPPAPEQEIPPAPPTQQFHPAPQRQINGGSFLSTLLPPGFDLGDLIVMLLLFLMAGDSQEDRNTAILTMALYFIL